MLKVLELQIKQKWDDRHWAYALTSEKPIEMYNRIKEDVAANSDEDPLANLTQEEQDWLRNSG